jgi:hypothetical protein
VFGWRILKVRGGNILIFICLVQFFEREGREGEGRGAKPLITPLFAFP